MVKQRSMLSFTTSKHTEDLGGKIVAMWDEVLWNNIIPLLMFYSHEHEHSHEQQ